MLNVLSRWSSIPPKCISVIGEKLCPATSRTIHQDFFFSQGFLDMHLMGKIGQKDTLAYLESQFHQICCFFTREGNIKAIVAAYFCCFTHVCSQKHNLIHLRPDTIHTSKGCKNLNPDRGKMEKTQLSHVPLGENKHIFSWNASRDTCSVLSGLAFSTWPSSFQGNIIST